MATYTQSGAVTFFPRWIDGSLTLADNLEFSMAWDANAVADAYWSGSVGLVAGGTSNLDLAQLNQTFFVGSTTSSQIVVDLEQIKLMLIKNLSPNHSVSISKAAVNGWGGFGASPTITLNPSGHFLWYNPAGLFVQQGDSVLKFSSLEQIFSRTGSTTTGSKSIALSQSATNIQVGMLVFGQGVPSASAVTGVFGNTLTISEAATATNANVALTIQWPLALIDVRIAGNRLS